MSFRWPSKDKDEVLDYSVDWSRWLAGATISGVTWYVDDSAGVKTVLGSGQTVNGLQNVAQTISGGVSTINLGLGTNNADYKITCAMTDNTGNLVERVIRLKIKEN